jgi:putative oxidoreductase
VARFLVPVGRFLFALIFLVSTPLHFQHAGVAYAAQAGTPLPALLVPLAGLLALFGGLSVLFGYHARIGALLLAVFLVPVTLIMHAFWSAPDAATAMLERVMFMKNLAMFGAALLLMYFGAGPISVDARQGRW